MIMGIQAVIQNKLRKFDVTTHSRSLISGVVFSVIVIILGNRIGLKTIRSVLRAVPAHRSDTLSFEPYFAGMNGDTEVYRKTVHPFTADIQKAIRRHQHPKNCSEVDYLIFRLWNNGLGSDYIGASTALAMAISTNRVLVLDYKEGVWAHADGCDVSTPECFFQPISYCTLADAKSLVSSGHAETRVQNRREDTVKSVAEGEVRVLEACRGRPYLHFIRLRLHELIPTALRNLKVSKDIISNGVFGSYSTYMIQRGWHTQASLYLLRLNLRMQEFARTALEGCAHSAEIYMNPRWSSAECLIRSTIGLPLRGSDKCYRLHSHRGKMRRRGEMECVSVDDTMESIEGLVAAQPWLTSALVTSEDRNLARKTKERLKEVNIGIRENKIDVQQGTGRPIELRSRDGTEIIRNYRVTESMIGTLTCQVMPMYHIIAIKSNFHSLIDMLAKVVPGKKAHSSYVLGDIDRASVFAWLNGTGDKTNRPALR